MTPMKEIVCPECGARRQTILGNYQYKESGLKNLWLEGVELFECACGQKFAIIPCVPELHGLIAQDLLKQKNQLSGREIRFLRKHIGLKAKDFAEYLGVNNVTVSRWERGEERPPQPTDRLIRLFYAGMMGVQDIVHELIKDMFREIMPVQEEQAIYFPIQKLRELTSCNFP